MRETMPKKPPQDKKRSPDLPRGKAYVRRRLGAGSTPKSLGDIMTGKGWLQNLKVARNAQQDWLSWLRERLPPELRDAAINVIPKERELVVMASSAAWSSRLRYALAEVEAQIKARDAKINKVSVRIAPLERGAFRVADD
jgi:hypothetical protein